MIEALESFFSNFPAHMFFAVQLLIAEYMFVVGLKKRSAPLPRLIFCTIFYLLISLFHPMFGSRWVRVLLLFFWSLLFLFVVVDNSFKACLFAAISAYAIQNLAFNLGDLIASASGVHRGGGLSYYLVTAAVFCVVYALCYFVVVRRFTRYGSITVKNTVCFAIATSTIAVVYSKNVLRSFGIMSDYQLLVLFTAVSCILILGIQYFALEQGKIREQNRIIEQLLAAEKNRMNNLKENMDIINMKCHDLRYHIGRYRDGEKKHEAFFDEIEKSINVYDTLPSTGNSALDVLLSDRLLFCNANKIQVSHIVDGSALERMEISDVYSLFGNALDNAIKSVRDAEEEKRIISLKVSKRDNCVQITVTNYCADPPTMRGGMPISDGDSRYHGFGVHSMKYIVEKYGGNILFDYADGMFTVSILFAGFAPISQK